jgi:hypothetical protein
MQETAFQALLVCMYTLFFQVLSKLQALETSWRVDPPSHAQPPPRLALLALILRALNAPRCIAVIGDRLKPVAWLRLGKLIVMMKGS